MIGCAVTANAAHVIVTKRRSRRPRPGRAHTSPKRYSRRSRSPAGSDSGGSTVITSRNVAVAVASTFVPSSRSARIENHGIRLLQPHDPAAVDEDGLTIDPVAGARAEQQQG